MEHSFAEKMVKNLLLSVSGEDSSHVFSRQSIWQRLVNASSSKTICCCSLSILLVLWLKGANYYFTRSCAYAFWARTYSPHALMIVTDASSFAFASFRQAAVGSNRCWGTSNLTFASICTCIEPMMCVCVCAYWKSIIGFARLLTFFSSPPPTLYSTSRC